MKSQLEAISNIDYGAVLLVGATVIANEAKNIVPVKTGFLRDSIEATQQGVTVGAEYASVVEYNQPYLRPAIDTKSREAEQAMAKEIERLIKEAVQ